MFTFRGIGSYAKTETTGIDITPMRPMEFYSVPCKVGTSTESEPVVQIGDEVRQGTLIAAPSGKFGLNIYSPISGKVLNILSKLDGSGSYSKHILILNDNQNLYEDLPPIEQISEIKLIERLKEAGLFDPISNVPTYLKYAYTGTRSYKTLLVLMDSTDPNDTVNQTIAEFRMEEVLNGAKYFLNVTDAREILFVFTDKNKKLAKKLKEHIAANKKNYDYKIKFIQNRYPYDNPYLLAKNVAKKKIGRRVSFLDAGLTIETAESCYNFCRAVEFNKPVTHKVVTIDGDNVIRKGNYFVQNGLSYKNLIEFIGVVDRDSSSMLVDGGLLCGKGQYDSDISISLTTNSVHLLKYERSHEQKELPCISCGRCSGVCPVKLNPQRIDRALIAEEYDELTSLKCSACIECGCCSYICPSKRFLTQRICTAKSITLKKGGAK